MAHHKKRKARNSSRATCYCKYWKKVEFKGSHEHQTRQEKRARARAREQLKDVGR